MTNLEQLYAAERRLESELDAVREQIREQINYLGLNKRIRPDDFVVTIDPRDGSFVPAAKNGVTVLHKPTGIARHTDSERSQHRNKAIALAAVKHELLAMGWREE